MPRPKRARQAAQPTKANNRDDEPQTRGRTRTTRSMGARMSTVDESALRAAEKSQNNALERLANEDITTTTGEDDTAESIEVGRRAVATPQKRDTTGLDLGDSMFSNLEDSFDAGDVPQTGRSDNSSLYMSSHMKPRSRSRQSSIIGRNDPPIRPSSRSATTPLMGSSFNISAFRRRAREPSILGTGRKSRPDVTATTTQDQASESEEEEEEDFAPEAESTPLNNRRRTRHSIQAEREASPTAPEMRESRKRKSDGVPESSDRPEKATRTEEPEEPEAAEESDSDSVLSSLPSPQALPRQMERPVTPNREQYAAPPVSSGSEDEGDFWPDIHGLAKRRRRPSVADPLEVDNHSNVSSPPSLTHSPNFGPSKAPKRGRSRTRRKSPPPMTTADLANLLPKRRHKKARDPSGMESDEEYDTSALRQGDDELSHLDNRTTRKKDSRQPSRGGRTTRSASRAKQTAASRAKENARTYSRRSSDKENQSDDDNEENEESMFQPMEDDTFDAGTRDTSGMATAEELKNAVQKFAEVDRWELEYEEATEPSSPIGAR